MDEKLFQLMNIKEKMNELVELLAILEDEKFNDILNNLLISQNLINNEIENLMGEYYGKERE